MADKFDPKRVANFQDIHNGEEWRDRAKRSEKLSHTLDFIHILDVIVKIVFRVIICLFFGFLLIYQNTWIYNTISSTLKNGKIQDLQIILSVIISGTLAETYLIARIIVEWVFTDIDYAFHKEKSPEHT